MKTRLLIIIGIIMLVVNSTSSVSNQADALSCGISPFTESFNRHDLLLHGILIEKNIDRSSFSNTRDALSMLVFETITVYKGEHQDRFTIKANISWDDYYVEGVDYILFHGAITNSCMVIVDNGEICHMFWLSDTGNLTII